ncbi:MAG: hypothetical protein WA639_11650, partial [Candidatus Acidiferrum sp.]
MNTKTTQLGDHIDLGSLGTSDNACPSVLFELTLKVRRATSPHVRFQLTTDALRSYRTAVD